MTIRKGGKPSFVGTFVVTLHKHNLIAADGHYTNEGHRCSWAMPKKGVVVAKARAASRTARFHSICADVATVTTNVLPQDLSVLVDRRDDRRLEVIAELLWGGVQLAVGTALVSLLNSLDRPATMKRELPRSKRNLSWSLRSGASLSF